MTRRAAHGARAVAILVAVAAFGSRTASAREATQGPEPAPATATGSVPTPHVASVDDAPDPSSAALEAEADAMVAALGDDSAGRALADVEEFKLNLYGFADFTYIHQLNDFAFGSPYPTFMVGNINLYAGAELGDGWRTLTEFRLLYVPHGTVTSSERFNPAATPLDTTVGDPADLDRPMRWGGLEIERAWLEYSAHPLLTIRGGQWLTPYGIWNVDHGSPVIIGVRRPYIIGEGLIPERQTGLLFYGSALVGTTELGYQFSLSNGRGPLDAYKDLDNNKGVTARVSAVTELPLGALGVGFTLYRGRYTDRPPSVAFGANGGVGIQYITRNRYDELSLGADLRWTWGGLTLQSEVITRETVQPDRFRTAALPRADAPPGFVPDFRTTGFYALAAYRLPWLHIMPFGGGEVYDAGSDLPNSKAIWGGLNVRPTPRVVLKAQWTTAWLSGAPTLGDSHLEVIELQAAWSF